MCIVDVDGVHPIRQSTNVGAGTSRKRDFLFFLQRNWRDEFLRIAEDMPLSDTEYPKIIEDWRVYGKFALPSQNMYGTCCSQQIDLLP